jgi:predicted nucleic acid-binding protein
VAQPFHGELPDNATLWLMSGDLTVPRVWYIRGMHPLIYLDNCCFNRPYDDQAQLKIRLEAEAKLHVQELVRAGQLSLVWSYVLEYENGRNPNASRRQAIGRWRSLAATNIVESPLIVAKASQMVAQGLKVLDALHLACAAEANADLFLTTDQGILRKRDRLGLPLRIVSPLEYLEKELGHDE